MHVRPHIDAIASALPRPSWSTDELIAAGRGRLSDEFVSMIRRLGVDKRHSVLENFPEVVFANAQPELALSANALAAAAVRNCFAKSSFAPDSVGLVLGITSSPARLLPSLVCDLLVQVPELSRSVDTLSISYMGCSALAKVVETARWYLTCHPDKAVLACFMDAITPLSPPLVDEQWKHFSEIPSERRQETVDGMHAFLFGDAAVAMLLRAEGDGPSFGNVVSLTNERPEDAELGTVPDGGSDEPVVMGRRLYTLSADVSRRGVDYASHTVRQLFATRQTSLSTPADAAALLMHTGSDRILNGLCREFGVAADSDEVSPSYRILREYGNTIGCSVPLMLAESEFPKAGEGLAMAFGLSFSCGAFTFDIPEGGWRP